MRAHLRLLAGLSLLLASAAGAAEPPSYRFDPFVQKPATSPLGLFTLEGAAAGHGLEWLALRFDYGHGLLALVDANGNKITDVIPDRLDAHLLASVGFRNVVSLGVDLPLTVYQRDGFGKVRDYFVSKGGTPELASQLFPSVRSYGLGDIRLVPKLALPFHRPFSLAVVPEIRLRTGSDENFLGDALGPIHEHAGPVFCPRLEAEGTIWRLRVLGELGYQARGEEHYFNLKVGDQITFGLGAEYALPQVWPETLTSWEVLAEFNGNTQTAAPFSIKKADQYETPLELVGGVRARFVHGVLAFAGVGSGLSGGGYGRELFRAFAGVGWEPPNVESTVPVAPEELDKDHDGVPDTEDACPDVPGPADGCPDQDGDGIPDKEDKCPAEPGPAENEGCPVEGPMVSWTPPKLTLRAGITFETGKADIKPESFTVLDEVGRFLKEHPQIKKVRVEGHTDNKGGAKANLDLSRRRAKSVVTYLTKHGIEAERLTSEGYGFERPIADNASALGRAKNRRVEFTVLDPPPDASPPPPEPAKSAAPPATPGVR